MTAANDRFTRLLHPLRAGRDAHDARRGGVRVTVTLLALLVIPLLGLAALSGRLVVDQRAGAVQGSRVDHGLGHVNRLMALVDAVHTEQNAVEFAEFAAAAGITPSQASAILHSDAVFTIGSTRRATDAAAAALGPASPVTRAELRSVRAQADAVFARDTVIDDAYRNMTAAVTGEIDRVLDELESAAGDTPGITDLAHALDLQDASVHAMGSGSQQASGLIDLAFGTPRVDVANFVRFGLDTADYETSVKRIDALHGWSLVGGKSRLTASADERLFDDAVARTLAGRIPVRDGDLAKRTTLLREARGSLARNDVLHALLVASSGRVHRTARALHADGERRYHQTVLFVVVLALLALAVALWFGRTITRPLRRLRNRAEEISGGHVDGEALVVRGPRETRPVSAAFNDVQANLRLLESKSRALAACTFDDPALAVPLPGPLGEAIQESVAVLSGSIEEREALRDNLVRQATHDPLTGMHNRAAAIDAIKHALARAARTGNAIALLSIDLVDFKTTNDTFGHDVGDEVLREVAARLHAVVRTGDFTARVGADEFLVVAEQVAGADEAGALAQRVIEAIAAPMELAEVALRVGACVGIAFAFDGEADPLHLIACADLALTRAREGGDSAVGFFEESLQQQLLRRADVKHALAATLERGGDELELYYQPVIDTGTGAIAGMEALIRWHRPGHGLVPPDDFISIAEASNLIIDVDLWVIDTAVRQLVAWADDPTLRRLHVAVNVSGRHLLSGSLEEHLADAIRRHHVDPARLIVEVTETVLLHDLPTVGDQLEAVRSLGIRVAIDDFGTGYTSLAHLQHLPIDTIKIDRSFVNQVEHARDRSLVAMVTELGHQLGVTIVAEGVETTEQRDAVSELGCDSMQGYLISRPVPVGDLVRWLDHQTCAGS